MPALMTPPSGRAESAGSEPDFIPLCPDGLDARDACLNNERVVDVDACEGPTNEEFACALRRIVEDIAGRECLEQRGRGLEEEKAGKRTEEALTCDPRVRHDGQTRAECALTCTRDILMRTDADARIEPECARTDELEYLDDEDKGQPEPLVEKPGGTYMKDKEQFEDDRSSCDWCEDAECLDGGMTRERAHEFQRECELAWRSESDVDVPRDVRNEGSSPPEHGQGRLGGKGEATGVAAEDDLKACLTYLGKSRLAYCRGRQGTPFQGASQTRSVCAEEAYNADAAAEEDVKMDESENEHKKESENDEQEETQERPDRMQEEEDKDKGDLSESSATAADEDGGAKDKGKHSESSSSAQASRLGTPVSFGPSTPDSYNHNHQKLGKLEGFRHNLLGEAFHEVLRGDVYVVPVRTHITCIPDTWMH
ncbi:hypothetical protein ONZ51_g12608 [Trametes cubensis]|uniref:Uncharacterized protein n=1 Tax=Trametes cubensis TaxID=1111947 RepID=A0AAD7TI66_9APHY|nr:hypothetical protein ONZ51_g12608 [Trametes cubensis]